MARQSNLGSKKLDFGGNQQGCPWFSLLPSAWNTDLHSLVLSQGWSPAGQPHIRLGRDPLKKERHHACIGVTQ